MLPFYPFCVSAVSHHSRKNIFKVTKLLWNGNGLKRQERPQIRHILTRTTTLLDEGQHGNQQQKMESLDNQLLNTPSSDLHHPTHYLLSSFQNSIPSWSASPHFFPTIVICKVEPRKKQSKLTSQWLSFPREHECFPLGFRRLRHIRASQWLEGYQMLSSLPYRTEFYFENKELETRKYILWFLFKSLGL